jgi:hypothetical protein
VATTSAVQETFGPVVVINTVAGIEEAVRRGFGRFHGDEGLRKFSYAKSTTRKRAGLGKDLQSFPAPRTSSMPSARHSGCATAGHSAEPASCFRSGASDFGL